MRHAAVLASALLLGACAILPDNPFGVSERPGLPLEGRVSVLAHRAVPESDPEIADVRVRLPRPTPNSEWPQAGGYANHAMHHIMVRGRLAFAWRTNIGTGASDERQLLAQPVVAAGRVFTVDAVGRVSSLDAASGRIMWRVTVLREDEKDAFGGGIAFAGGALYVTTGAGDVLALDAGNGGLVWRASVGVPVRGAPTVNEGRVFVVTHDNQLFALDAGSGRQLWSHAGIAEPAQLLGATSPAAVTGLVVAAFSSGELVALRADNGRLVWNDHLIAGRQAGALASLSDIKGSPVIDRDRVYAISHGGRLVAITLRTGERIWSQNVSGVQTPWIAGDFLFVLTTEGNLVCLSRLDGRIRWTKSLPRRETKRKEKQIFWSGPILVSDRLIVVGSHGEALTVSPYTGRLLGALGLPGGVELPPLVANNTVYFLTNQGDLLALR